MKLTQLDGKLSTGMLRFNCPVCKTHEIVVPIGAEQGNGKWKCSGALETATVEPSIKTRTSLPYLEALKPGEQHRWCLFHAHVTDGAVVLCADSGIKSEQSK